MQSIGANINTYENARIRGVEYKMLRVRYQYEYQAIPDAQAWNDFFFDADWLCKIARCRSGSSMSLGSYQERKITFGTTGDSIHLPKKTEIFQVDEQKSIRTLDRTYIMSDHLVAPVTEDECTLTSFGLPEPVGVNWDQKPTKHLWWIVLAVGFLFAAIFFGLIARRKHRRASPGKTV